LSYRKAVIGGAVSLLILIVSASSAFASTTNNTGGGGLGASKAYVKWVLVDGKPVPTKSGTPQRIVNVIKAATRIAGKPYTYGGGHAYYNQVGGAGGYTKVGGGYDCSGSVSFALHANGHSGNFLREPEASGALERYGKAGASKWITIYTNAEHAYMVVAGLRFDTVAAQENVSKGWPHGDRWSKNIGAGAADTAAAFVKRHPAGW
jgi:hypothetical protein